MNWVAVIAFALAGLIVGLSQYFLVYADAPRPLRILVPSLAAISFFICGILAGRG